MPCYNFGVREVLRMSDKVKAQSVTVEEKKKEVIKNKGHMIMFIVQSAAQK